LILETCRGE